MKYPGMAQYQPNPQLRQIQRMHDANMIRTLGTQRTPQAPRGLVVQSSSRGFLLSWSLPATFDDIVGWRIYKDTENQLYGELRDRGTRSYPIEATAGASPSYVNVFVSSLNARGMESPKVQIQGKATAEAGAPSVPTIPTSFTGTNRSSGFSPSKQSIK